MGEGVSTDFKSLNRIEISWLVQVLLNFEWFRGSPRGVGSGWMGWGVVRGAPHPHAHVCACTHMYTHAHMYDIIVIQWERPFAWNYHVYHTCTCVHVHACGHVWGQPPKSTTPHPQELQEAENTKFNNSWTNRDNLILFEDSLPLNIPEII